jgi:hypothetical protein
MLRYIRYLRSVRKINSDCTLWYLQCDKFLNTSTWRRRHHGPPKCWYSATPPHGVITQKAATRIIIAMKLSNLVSEQWVMSVTNEHQHQLSIENRNELIWKILLSSLIVLFYLALSRFYSCESIRQLVGLLGRVIGPTQGLYLHRTTQHRETQTHIHAQSRSTSSYMWETSQLRCCN